MAGPVQRQSWTATADYNAILHMDRDGDGDGDGDDVMLGMCRQFGIPYSTKMGAFSSHDYDDGDNKINKIGSRFHHIVECRVSDCQFANYGWFSAKQFKTFHV